MNWVNFLIILFFCLLFSLIRNSLNKLSMGFVRVVLLGCITGFMSLFLVMLLNMAGINYYYFDEFFISFVVVLVGPIKFMDDFI